MKKLNHILYCFILVLLLDPDLKARVSPSVKISGEVTNPIELHLNDFSQFTHTEVIRKDNDGKDHVYSGVILSVVLQRAGVPSGKDIHGKNLAKYVLVEASDGYKVVFALAELDKDFTDRTIIFADQVDGKALTTEEGPFRRMKKICKMYQDGHQYQSSIR